MRFLVTYATNDKIELATITPRRGAMKLKRLKGAQDLGYHIPASNDRELERCADYLSKETAAISATCIGYRVHKLA
jgi:hypothetical protein